MNYKLIQKLKDTGFPLKEGECGHCGNYWNEERFPTLEELIDACGKDFRKLEFNSHSEFKTGVPFWYAYEQNEMRNFNESGKTSLEAVANLYLALKKQ